MRQLLLLTLLLLGTRLVGAQDLVLIDRLDDRTLVEGEPLEFQLTVGEDIAGYVRYGARGLPPGARLDPRTGRFTWTPRTDEVGSYTVEFFAERYVPTELTPGGPAEDPPPAPAETLVRKSVLFSVSAPAYAPTFSATLRDTTVREGEPLILLLRADDANRGDALTFHLEDAPDGAHLDPDTGTFTWTPSQTDVGFVPLTFTVRDSGGLEDRRRIYVNVQDIPYSPLLDAGPRLRYALLDEPLTFEVTASDADQEPVTIQLVDYPYGARLDPAAADTAGRTRATFAWTPSSRVYRPNEEVEVTIAAVDPTGREATAQTTIRFSNVPRPPDLRFITSSPPASLEGERPRIKVAEGQQLQVELRANDPNGGPLTFRQLGCPCDADMHLDVAEGTFRWRPGYDFVSTGSDPRRVTLSFEAIDPTGLTSTPLGLEIEVADRVNVVQRRQHYTSMIASLDSHRVAFEAQLDLVEKEYQQRNRAKLFRTLTKITLSSLAATLTTLSLKGRESPSKGLTLTALSMSTGAGFLEALELANTFRSPAESERRVNGLKDQIWQIEEERRFLLDKYGAVPEDRDLEHDDFEANLRRADELMKRSRASVHRLMQTGQSTSR